MLSHTATGEWQSFELRMRRRRAERLALRAEAAASAGFDDDARACLAEARMLAPDLPAIAVAEAALERPPEPLPAVVAPVPSSRSAFLVFATACILLAAFFAGWLAYRDAPDASPVVPAQVQAAVAPAAPPATTPVAPPAASPEPVRESVALNSDGIPAPSETPVSRDVKAPQPEPEPAPVNAPAVGASEALPPLPAPDVTPAPPAPAPPARIEPPAVTAPTPTAGLGGTVLLTPSVDVKAPVVEASQEPMVKATLNRYASAYSALDADAAERVWPTVNRGALARAFDGLSRQSVNLGDCRIDVTGNKARALCAGSATWSPKVGSGTHTESREWTFDLVRVGPDWQILNARTQNR